MKGVKIMQKARKIMQKTPKNGKTKSETHKPIQNRLARRAALSNARKGKS